MKQAVRILLADNHDFVRKAVRRLLEVDPDLTVCAEAETPEQVERALQRQHPDLLILDLVLQQADGLALIRSLKARHAKVPILALSLHKETMFAELTLQAGAQGYLMKDDAAHHLVDAVHEIMAGRIYVSEAIRQGIFSRMRADSASRPGTRGHLPPEWNRYTAPRAAHHAHAIAR
jgi:DNA-binding NarL/FixJ family response regulator